MKSWSELFLEQCADLQAKRAATTGERKVYNYLNNDFAGIIKKIGLDFNHYSVIHSNEFRKQMKDILLEFNFFGAFNKNAAKEKLKELIAATQERGDLTYPEHANDHKQYHITFSTWLEPLESLSTGLSIELGTLGK